MNLSPKKKRTLAHIVKDLESIDKIQAIVLGGSHCIGMATEASDLDIGIYYHEYNPFAINDIRSIAEKHQSGPGLTVTDFYQWGRWVNGGAWINTENGEVDFIYRNIEQVQRIIENSKKGLWENDFEQQPPYGFSSIIYLAEVNSCIPLYDPDKIIEKLKREVIVFPSKLRQTVIQQALWSTEFTIWQADKFADKLDFYNTVGCITRAIKSITEALLAINEQYSMGDKYAIEIIKMASKSPDDLNKQIEDILTIDKDNLTLKTKRLRYLFNTVVSLADGQYQPRFEL
jgi:hypothetical protein